MAGRVEHSFDVVLVGSGINSLACAALLGRAGWSACVLEQAETFGGAIKTAEITEPGYLHEVFSSWHPLWVSSEAYAELGEELGSYGLEYLSCEPGAPVSATLFPDGEAAFLSTSAEANAAELARLDAADGRAWTADRRDFDRDAPVTMRLLSVELASAAGARLAASALARLGPRRSLALAGSMLCSSRTWLEQTFASERARGLLAPWVLHTGLGPDDSGSGFMNRAIAALLERVGLPLPRGGGRRLVEALVEMIRSRGGECRSGQEVVRVLAPQGRATGVRLASGEVVQARRAVVCNVPPPALYWQLLEGVPLPGPVRREAARFRFGRSGMQVHYALSRPPSWQGDGRLAATPVVHLSGGLDAVRRAVGEAELGLLPAEATIVCGQPCVLDPARAPEGGAVLWIQLQELPARPRGDAAGEMDVGDGTWTEGLRERYADRIQRRLARHIDGFEPTIRRRVVLSPADIAASNPNLVGGDIYSGACQLDQLLLWRPRPGLRGHRTVVPGLYEIGASTHPGPGLGAGSGTLVARQLLRDERRLRPPGPRGLRGRRSRT